MSSVCTTVAEIRNDPVATLYGGGFTLLATPPDNSDVKTWARRPTNSWVKLGGPGATFAATAIFVYGISPNRDGVWKWNNDGTDWRRIGGPAKDLIVGGYNSVFATNPDSGDIFHWISGDKWEKVGGPGFEFAVDGQGGLYGISPNKGGVMKWQGSGMNWTKIGGAASRIFAGGAGVFVLNPDNTEIRRWTGAANTWEMIGGGGKEYAVTDDGLFGLNSAGQVWKWDGGENWSNTAAPSAKQLVASP
ncbi:hypothetical protein QBC35DRAFT_460500 [Podospora australis]|uniref:Uncharacterized protein n=1 Tax=Podospora australis TaxID=1536484 RepID=A0AAN6WZ53_9PEZI|nr:hypothetical protein QBC35DRAFT_460500 [Podospora australis]